MDALHCPKYPDIPQQAIYILNSLPHSTYAIFFLEFSKTKQKSKFDLSPQR